MAAFLFQRFPNEICVVCCCDVHCASLLLRIKSEFMTAYRLNFHKETNAQPIWMSEFLYP